MGAYAESTAINGAQPTLWNRKIQIIFSSKTANKNGKGLRLIIGDNDGPTDKDYQELQLGDYANKHNPPGTNFDIRVSGTKYLALTKDKGVIEINNLEYDTVALIMNAQLFKIEIKIGYGSLNNLFTIAKGEVSYISQKIHSHHDTTTYITYASEFVAAWSQSRINFSVNSGINLYSLINYLFIENGGTEVKTDLDVALKYNTLQNVYNEWDNSANIIDKALATQGTTYQLSSDSSLSGNVISCTSLGEKRVINLQESQIMIMNGNPTVTSQGLKIKLIPSFNFVPGDILIIDNAMIDVSGGMNNPDSVTNTFNVNYMDTNGQYMIQEINYVFENRGSNFYLDVTARAVSLFENISGAS